MKTYLSLRLFTLLPLATTYAFIPAVPTSITSLSGRKFNQIVTSSPSPSHVLKAAAATAAPPATPSQTGDAPSASSPATPQQPIRLSIPERARTVTYVATAATLGTLSRDEVQGVNGLPFGSYVDYILDDKGWPVLLLSEQSLHTQNIKSNPHVSLFVQMPKNGAESSAALSRVTLIGRIVPVEQEELPAIRTAYSIVHSYSERLVESPKFSFCKIQPEQVYFVGGFGVLSKWITVEDYEVADPDILAHEVSRIVNRINNENEQELRLMCRHFLGAHTVDQVQTTSVDRLGIDLRVTSGELTDEYRIGFRQKVVTVEDAKSELMKMFQEAWERENGYAWVEDLPQVQRYAEDILRK